MGAPDFLEASNAPPKNVAANRNDEVAGTGQEATVGKHTMKKSLKYLKKPFEDIPIASFFFILLLA